MEVVFVIQELMVLEVVRVIQIGQRIHPGHVQFVYLVDMVHLVKTFVQIVIKVNVLKVLLEMVNVLVKLVGLILTQQVFVLFVILVMF